MHPPTTTRPLRRAIAHAVGERSSTRTGATAARPAAWLLLRALVANRGGDRVDMA